MHDLPTPTEVPRELASPETAEFAASLVALRPRLQRYARSLAHDADAAEDLVQDAMLRAWRAQSQFAAETNLKAWTFRILRNLFLSERRRDRFHGDYDEVSAERDLAAAGNQDAAVDLAEVEIAIESLPEEQRQALKLVAIAGLTTEEAAQRIGTPPGTVKSRVSRARAALSRILTGQMPQSIGNSVRAPERRRHAGDWARSKAAGRPLWIG